MRRSRTIRKTPGSIRNEYGPGLEKYSLDNAHETKDYVSILSIQTLIVTIVRCFNPKLGNVQSGSWKFILAIHRIAFCIKGGKS